jgi:uncharacterized protein (DUF58 family)
MNDPERPSFEALHYRLRFRPQSGPPGAHRGRGAWTDGEFLRHAPLLGQFDPRRIDLLTSLRDPFGGLHVRVFSPRRAIPVILIADVSASMGFGGHGRSLSRLARLAGLIAASAYDSGDMFGLIGADADIREDLVLPAARRRGLAEDVYARILETVPRGSACGFVKAADLLPRRRSLVFLVSDFLMPLADVEATLDSLWRHDVVPILVRDRVMEGEVPAFGLVMTRDLETGRERLLFLRPSLRAAWQRAASKRLADLEQVFAERGRRAFHLVDDLDVDALADFFVRAFSSEMDTGSRRENATNKKVELLSGAIGSESTLAGEPG